MKRVYISLFIVLLIGAIVYVWAHRRDIAFLRNLLPAPSQNLATTLPGKQLNWQLVDESGNGFKLEMPGEPRQVIAEATSETGTTEPVSMLLVKPDSETSFAVAWQDKPPVARVNDLAADKTLDQARDGALARTDTSQVSESRATLQGYPARDVVARNSGGGILDTRLIFAGSHLYMLIATSSSATTRRINEVQHFFDSFSIAGDTQIPETSPPVPQ